MGTDRQATLRGIAVGDIFHAEASNVASLICLTMSVTEKTIQARNVATQIIYDFDRATGHADWYVYGTRYACTVDSVAPLPSDIHQIMLDLDRKHREVECRLAENPDWTPSPGQLHFTKDEIRGLLFIDKFYEDNQI
jgi:hypothetical protein